MKVALTGSTGLIGVALSEKLRALGHEVIAMRRQEPVGDSAIYWNPATKEIDADSLEGIDALVHLAGENIASARWTKSQKARIRDSRIGGTRLLSDALAKLKSPPKVFVSGSAIGFYGERGDEVLSEESESGAGFLPETCVEWEDATKSASEAGVRVVLLRTGVALSPKGGAIARMMTPFKLGIAGKLGSGKQYMSWISLDDIVGAIIHAMNNDTLSGAVNGTSPNPVTNLEFTKAMGRVLRRPTIFPMPAFVVRLLFGEMGEAAILASARVEPKKLLESGYKFERAELESALRYQLKR